MEMLTQEQNLIKMVMVMSNFGGTQKAITKYLTLIMITMLSFMAAITGSFHTQERFGFYPELQELLKTTSNTQNLILIRLLAKIQELRNTTI